MSTYNVLVVEDGATDQLVLSKQLESLRCRVTTVESAEAALNVWNSSDSFDLLLVDWNLPGMNGLSFVERIKGDSSKTTPRIVMITGETSMEKINEAIMIGVDEYIMKPVITETFREKLQLIGVEFSK